MLSVRISRSYHRLSLPQRLQGAALLAYLLVFVALFAYGQPGIGISQGFYVAIVLAALGGGLVTGVSAGVLATLLYEIALWPNAGGTVSVRMGMHLLWYVAAGAIVGYFASLGRAMLAEALHALEDLLSLARRDLDTGARSPEGLHTALTGRVDRGKPFGLLVGELGRHADGGEGDLRAAIAAIAQELAGAEVARVGPTHLAVIVPDAALAAVSRESSELERLLGRRGWSASFGWAVYPSEGEDGLSLFRSASERLYARRVVRGEWMPTAATAGLTDEPVLQPPPA